ncbi:MAG: hypothetical protein U1F43_28040 [Myxococcota bacterium]
MKPLLGVILATALGACSVMRSVREADLREVGLFVPGAIGDEPRADRVIVLHHDGRTTIMEDAVIRRSGATLRLEKARSPTVGMDLPFADVAAVEIERRASGPTEAVLGTHDPDAVQTVDGGTADVIGGLLLGAVSLGLIAVVAFGN